MNFINFTNFTNFINFTNFQLCKLFFVATQLFFIIPYDALGQSHVPLEYPDVKNKNMSYLIQHHVPVDFSLPADSTFADMFDSLEMQKNKLFLIGMLDGVSANTGFAYKLFSYLYSHANVRYLLIDASYSIGLMLSHYLESGNEAILLRALWNKKSMFTKEYTDLFRFIRKFNLTKDSLNRTEIVGIGIDGGYEADFWALDRILKGKSIPSEVYSTLVKTFYINGDIQNNFFQDSAKIDSFIVSLQKDPSKDQVKMFDKFQLKEDPLGEIQVMIDFLISDMPDNTEFYEKFLGDDFFDFWIIIKGLRARYDGKADRDLMLQINLLNLYPRLINGNMLGLLSRNYTHLNQKKFYLDQFASNLNDLKTSALKNKVLSIGMYYKNCRKYTSTKLFSDLMINQYDVCTSKGVVLYKMNGKQTPFRKKAKEFPYLAIVKEQNSMQWLRPRFW